MDLLLKDLRWHNGNEVVSGDVRIHKGLITEIGNDLEVKKREYVEHFRNHFLYPGLINAHDHLEMNLYSKLGTPPYNNYVEWANDIYKPNQSPSLEIERVEIKDRLLWGGVKNLISGVTTVVHHNPWHRFLGKKKFPVRVLEKIAWAHSLASTKQIQKIFPKKNNISFVIHAGEGIDELAFSEIAKLDGLGLLRKNTVLIHAIALKQQDIDAISKRQAAVVWCPASNIFMFDKTAPLQKLKNKVRVAIGSDSTLTGSSTFLDEMKFAHQTGLANSVEIYEMATSQPAAIFNLPIPSIAISQPADFFIVPIKHENYCENLMLVKPSNLVLVVINGEIKLLDAKTTNDWTVPKHSFTVQGVPKYTDIDIAALKIRIEKKVKTSILEANPLWRLIST